MLEDVYTNVRLWDQTSVLSGVYQRFSLAVK
jgi:hypothetical protein